MSVPSAKSTTSFGWNLRRGTFAAPLAGNDTWNSFEDITTCNNFYEFGLDKSDPSRYAGRLKTSPWTVKVEGHVAKPAAYALDDLLLPHPLEERVYRLRCVEGWSMVIPWVRIPLGAVIRRFEPTARAKFVEFTTLLRPSEMPGQRTDSLEWLCQVTGTPGAASDNC